MADETPTTDWDTWLTANAGRFLLFARQQARCLHDAEDILQEALVESWRRSGGKPEAALVFTTIRRRAIDLGRRTDRRTHREERASAEVTHFTVSAGDEPGIDLAELEQALKHLPASQRDVLTLKFWGGLTFAEVATTLEIPPGTAASRYRLALETLRETLTATVP
ncbi:MAG: RNA polymerase sigma factor [Luteolibacter sp.]